MFRHSHKLELKKRKLWLKQLQLDMERFPRNKEQYEERIKGVKVLIERLQKQIDEGIDKGPRNV